MILWQYKKEWIQIMQCSVCIVMSYSLQFQGLVAYQAPLSMGICRQEHWSGLPFPSRWNLPIQGSNLCILQVPFIPGRFFTSEPPSQIIEMCQNKKREERSTYEEDVMQRSIDWISITYLLKLVHTVLSCIFLVLENMFWENVLMNHSNFPL